MDTASEVQNIPYTVVDAFRKEILPHRLPATQFISSIAGVMTDLGLPHSHNTFSVYHVLSLTQTLLESEEYFAGRLSPNWINFVGRAEKVVFYNFYFLRFVTLSFK